MKTVKVSVIMGIYNCSKYLDEAIKSILNQNFQEWELIMCDDGSIDDTYRIAKKYEKEYYPKIIVLQNEKNMGLNYTLNKCLKKAKGEYIARQDGDDFSNSNRFEKEINFLDSNPNYSFVSSNMFFFDEKGVWGSTHMKEFPNKYDFIKASPFCHAPCMIRKEVIEEVDGYTVDDKLLRVEDYNLWFKIYSKGHLGYNLQERLYNMRDNREAYKRRNFKNRVNEARVKFIGFKMLKMPLYTYLYCLRPLIVALLPSFIYDKVHKIKNNNIKLK